MPPKGKADTAGYQQLKKDLSAQAPGKLYILHGEETYLRDYCLNQLKELILSGGMGTFNFHEIPAKEKIGRAKFVEADQYVQAYADIAAEMEQEIAAIVEKAGADV